MSIKKWALASILVLASGLSIYIFTNIKPSSRNSAAFLQSKFTSKGIINRLIQIKLNFSKAKADSEKVEISANVSMPFDFNEKLYFKWQLGPDVILAEGELSGEINGLLKTENKKIFLTVKGFSKESNHHIRFEVRGAINDAQSAKYGKNIYGDALIASDFENTFENTVQNVERIKATQ